MKQFDVNFKTNLYETISNIENNSLVEIVLIIKPSSGKYTNIAWSSGAVLSFLVYSFLMFSPFPFSTLLIYFLTITSFAIGYYLCTLLPAIQYKLIGRRRMERNVELYARATFQKGGIHHTSAKIGTLIYCSWFEKMVYVLPDRGAKVLVPEEEWQKMTENLNQAFQSDNPSANLLTELGKLQPLFSTYIPPVPNDINEIPDNLDIEIG